MTTKVYIIRNGKKHVIKDTKKGGKVTYSRECLECSQLFLSNRTTALYCSNSCRAKKHRRDAKFLEKWEHEQFLKAKYEQQRENLRSKE